MVFKLYDTTENKNKYFNKFKDIEKYLQEDDKDLRITQRDDVISIWSATSFWISNGIIALTEEELLNDLNNAN